MNEKLQTLVTALDDALWAALNTAKRKPPVVDDITPVFVEMRKLIALTRGNVARRPTDVLEAMLVNAERQLAMYHTIAELFASSDAAAEAEKYRATLVYTKSMSDLLGAVSAAGEAAHKDLTNLRGSWYSMGLHQTCDAEYAAEMDRWEQE